MTTSINEVPNNQVLIGNIVSRKFSKYISDDLNIEESFYDIADSIVNYMNSLSLDKRGIAITGDYHQRVWDVISTRSEGAKQTVFSNMQLFNQMVISMIKPQSSLILVPDQYLITVAALDSVGSELTFLNDQSLFNFENFVITNDAYPFSGNYSVIDYQDLIEESFSEKYDFIFTGSIALYGEIGLLDVLVNSLNSGGCLIVGDSGSMAEIYQTIDYIMMGDKYHDALQELDGTYKYHIPFGIGFDIIIKK